MGINWEVWLGVSGWALSVAAIALAYQVVSTEKQTIDKKLSDWQQFSARAHQEMLEHDRGNFAPGLDNNENAERLNRELREKHQQLFGTPEVGGEVQYMFSPPRTILVRQEILKDQRNGFRLPVWLGLLGVTLSALGSAISAVSGS